jgi:hypothetical protein
MSVLVLNDDDVPSAQPSHSMAVTMLASDIIWGAAVYCDGKVIGSIARLYLNQTTGAIERVEITQRLGRPALFVRWSELLFDIGPLRVRLIAAPVDRSDGVQQTLLQRLSRFAGFRRIG